MTFPTIPTAAASTLLISTAAGSANARTFPSLSSLTKNSGDLLIAVAVAYQSSAASGSVWSGWPTGWTELKDVGGGTSSMSVGIAYKWSTGTETGTFTITQAATITGGAVMWLMAIPGAHPTQVPSVSASLATGTTSVAAAGALTASWGSDDNLFIVLGGNGETSITGSWTGAGTTPPTNYTGLVNAAVADTSTVGQADSSVAFRQLTAASDTIGAFSGGDVSNARNAAIALVVRPGTPTQTSVAQVGLASQPAPSPQVSHVLHIRGRVQSAATATFRAALYEGATNISGDLESSALSTTITTYNLAISDANAANIVSYSDLSIKFWGYSSAGQTPVVEVEEVWLETPVGVGGSSVTGQATLTEASAETAVAKVKRGGIASLSEASAETAVAKVKRSGIATLSETSAATVSALVKRGGVTSLSEASAEAVTGRVKRGGVASLSEASAETVSAFVKRGGVASLSETSAETVTAKVQRVGQANLSASSTLTAVGRDHETGQALLAETSSLTAAGRVVRTGQANLTESSSLTATGSVSNYAAHLTEASSMAVSASVAVTGRAALSETSTETAAAHVKYGGQASLSITTTETVAGRVVRSGQANMSEASTATVAGSVKRGGLVSISVTVTETATARVNRGGQVNLSEASTIIVLGSIRRVGQVTLSESSSMTSVGRLTLTGQAALVETSLLRAIGSGGAIAVIVWLPTAITMQSHETVGAMEASTHTVLMQDSAPAAVMQAKGESVSLKPGSTETALEPASKATVMQVKSHDGVLKPGSEALALDPHENEVVIANE